MTVICALIPILLVFTCIVYYLHCLVLLSMIKVVFLVYTNPLYIQYNRSECVTFEYSDIGIPGWQDSAKLIESAS